MRTRIASAFAELVRSETLRKFISNAGVKATVLAFK
jgi:hypothetical protein